MKRSIVETFLGAFVLVVAGVFLTYSYSTANVGTAEGYEIYAEFSTVGGLQGGDDVQISGIKVGSVNRIELQPESYMARVYMDIEDAFEIPVDSSALISSKSLMGGLYLALQPGGDEEMLEDGGEIEYTQAPQNLEELLGKFIFTMQDSKGSEEDAE